ncbi:helix-turn-helix domain-containing protein [Xanthomonas campestris]|uniref:helix-turn-helix domain-containing protein n=1 Tax=Xanthomonas campestris TaxID=339 RepID=UPI003CCFE6D1
MSGFSKLHPYGVLLTHLRRMRRDAGLTQVELAKAWGTSQAVISKIERGERRLDLVEFVSLCKAMGLSPEQQLRCLLADFDTVTSDSWQLKGSSD